MEFIRVTLWDQREILINFNHIVTIQGKLRRVSKTNSTISTSAGESIEVMETTDEILYLLSNCKSR